MLYVVFCSLDGRELFSCAAADMAPEEKRATKRALAHKYGIQAREIYCVDKWR